MTRSRSSNDERFPPLEYLKVVGYFRSDVDSPDELFRQAFELISERFEDRISLSNGTNAILTCDSSDINDELWRLNKELHYYECIQRDSSLRELIERLLPMSKRLRYRTATFGQQGCRTSRYKAFDYVWKLHYSSENTYPNHQFDCMCVFGFSTHLFAEDCYGLKRQSAAIADDVVRLLLAHGDLYYALMDGNYFREDGGGWCYHQAGPTNWSNVRFRIEQEMWNSAKQTRRDYVRGVFPGQYLSPFHLEKLGGKDAFVSSLLSVRDRRSDLITDLGDDGIVLRLSPTPIDSCAHGLNSGSSHEIGTWVFHRFREAGLFL